MTLSKERVSLNDVARKVLEEATTTALGAPICTVITFHLKQKFRKDPSEAFIDDPKAFYLALEAIFGAGAKSIISIVAALLIKKYGMTYNSEEFMNLIVKGDESSKKALVEILSRIADET